MQFIICTHSHFIINESTEGLYIMDFPKSEKDNQLIDAAQLKGNDELDLLLGNLGLLAITSGRPIILVEGPMDVDILSIFFESINMQSTLLPMSGKAQIFNVVASLNRIIQKLDQEGIKLHAIVDKDRGNNPTTNVGRIHVLPVYCMENFLISDLDCVYDALKVTVGQNKLKEIISGKQVNDVLEQIINSLELKNFEIASRLNESLSFRISTENVALTENEILKELEKTYNSKKTCLHGLLTEITKQVDDHVKNKNYGELNGKNIIRSLAARYNANADNLTRAIALSIMNKYGKPPSELVSILNNVVPIN